MTLARTRGYEVLRGQVPQEALDRTLRLVHCDLKTHGLPQEWLSDWLWSSHWFPHLRWDDEVLQLLDHLPAEVREGELCDPQLLLQLPDTDESVELVPHVDQTPEWANGRPYARIVGIALTRNDERNGGLVVWPLDGGEPQPVELDPGDAIVFDPQLPHTSGLNRTGAIRYAVYFRFLQS